MNNFFFECTVKFDKVQETGLIKKVSEKYIVEALSFTEAEMRISNEMRQYISGDFDVTAIRRLQVADIFESQAADADRWYKAKLAFFTLDERTLKEKRTVCVVLVHAKNFDDARYAIQEGMKGTLGDWENAVLSETPVIDLYRWQAEK